MAVPLRRALGLALFALCLCQAQPTAGRRPDGGAILPNGWAITPAGKQVELSTLPQSITLHRDGRRAFVLQAGYRPPSLAVLDLEGQRRAAELQLPDAWLGLTVNRAGDRLFVGGGGRASVLELAVSDQGVTPSREFPAVERPAADDFIGDVLLSADEGLLYAANLFSDSVSVLNAKSGIRLSEFPTGRRPYRMIPGLNPQTVWISHWGEASVALYSLAENGRRIDAVRTGGLPSDILIVPGAVEDPLTAGDGVTPPIAARLFVACAQTNSVWVFGLSADQRPRFLEQLDLAPGAPAGAAPTSLALSADGQTLAIVSSGGNSIALADISEARPVLLGAIPTGWYPTDAAWTADGRLVYLNGKGGGSTPNPNGPDPTERGRAADYLPAQQTGSVGFLPPLSAELLQALTTRVVQNTLYDPSFEASPDLTSGSPLAAPSPIEKVVLVIKENRSYDQLFGDLPGEGDPDLLVFGDDVAPNHRKLAREFVLFDNFYAAGDVSLNGLPHSTAAFANDFLEKLWPARQARRLALDPFLPTEPAALSPAGAVWANAQAAGLSVRTYGLPVAPGQEAIAVEYPGFDLKIPDGRRVEMFLADYEKARPRLAVVYLPNDHTAGRSPGYPTAEAMMAEHDDALGRLVEAISQGPDWAKTAIFVMEDDAQDGADHIDGHRTVCLLASPYARREAVDSTFYSTHSVLRTIELILGLRPMTWFDAAATPLDAAFQRKANPAPYEAVRPEQPFDEMNPEGPAAPPRRVEAPGPRLVAANP